MTKITIERETLERAVDILDRRLNWNPVVDKLCSEINAALAAQPAEQEPVAWLRFQEHADRPTTIHLCDSDHPKAFKVYATLPQPAKPQCSPSQAKSLALLDLDSVEHMQGGANGPTIRLRGFINAQTGPTAPQPPIDNAFVADGCEQFSPPSEPAPVPCCGKYETCSHACTPRGKWLGRREAERAALAAQPADIVNPISQQEPVAWRHSKTGRLYDSAEEAPLADGDEWAEPLYLAAPPQPAPAAWRQWSTKQHDWDYSTNRGDLRSDTAAEPLFLAPAQPADEIEHLRADLVSCRGTVKMELSHYERLAMVHGKTVLAANYEAEAQRLSDLLDRIDAMKDTP